MTSPDEILEQLVKHLNATSECPSCHAPFVIWNPATDIVIEHNNDDFSIVLVHDRVRVEAGAPRIPKYVEDGKADKLEVSLAIAEGRACWLGRTKIRDGLEGLLAECLLTGEPVR